eukprot:COSAG05_NODE_22532_length_264_cov_0.630303_1_plen_87_part_11
MRRRLWNVCWQGWYDCTNSREVWRLAAMQAKGRMQQRRMAHVLAYWYTWADNNLGWQSVERHCVTQLAHLRLGFVLTAWSKNAQWHR